MKVLIDALTAREGGGVTYLRQVIPALRRVAPEHEYHVLLSRDYQLDLLDELGSVTPVAPIALGAADLVGRLRVINTEIPKRLIDSSFDVLFTVNEVGCIRPTRPHVLLARNYSIFAPLGLYPTVGARLSIALYRLTREPLARLALRRAAHVAFVSDTYRRAIVDRLKLDEARTSVIHHGVDPLFTELGNARSNERRPGSYILCVSSLAPHKNYETLIRAYAAARSSAATGLPPLAIAGGGADLPYGQSLRALAAGLGVASDIRFLGRVPHGELPAIYGQAALFVFPSRLETFGQPLLEAMGTGTPIIASDSSVAREVCGDAAVYFDAESPNELAACLTHVLSDESTRQALARAGRNRAASFSWDRTARETVDRLTLAATRA